MISNLLGRKALIVPGDTPCEVVALVPMPQGYASFIFAVRVESGENEGVIEFHTPEKLRVVGPTEKRTVVAERGFEPTGFEPTPVTPSDESDDTDEVTKRLSQSAKGIDPNGTTPLTPRLRRQRLATETE